MSDVPLVAIPLLIAGGASGGIVMVGIAVCGLCWWRHARHKVELNDSNPLRSFYRLRAPNKKSAVLHYKMLKKKASSTQMLVPEPAITGAMLP